MTLRVLFVDDDPQILSGLRRMLRPRAREWEMVFTASGREAMEVVDARPVDVVVTDMRMPEMDGAELLEALRQSHPDTVRIVLSGQSEMGMALRAARVAHQFLSKPCDADELLTAVERACAVRDRLTSPALRRIVGDLGHLPSPPGVIVDLNVLLLSDDSSLDEIAQLVSTDPALAAKLLQLVNSAFFGLGKRLTSVRDAVGYLGMDVVRNLAVASTAFDALDDMVGGRRFLDDQQAHALMTTSVASELVPTGPMVHDAFVAALLHDIGNLVLARGVPGAYREVQRLAIEERLTPSEAEQAAFGTTHAEIGAYLLSLWGLPAALLEAVARHHDAPSLPDRNLDVVHVTYVANSIACLSSPERRAGAAQPKLDDGYLAELGLADKVQALLPELP